MHDHRLRHRAHCLALLCLGLLALPCLAATNPYAHNGFSPGLLDASTPQQQRLKLFAHVMELANHGQVRAQDLAGTLYWRGHEIQGSPVAANLAQARILLSNAAIHGRVLAMAKLGELELEAGRLQQAMVWAQLYAHYLDPLHSARKRHGRRYNYASDLMHRITQAGGQINDAVGKDVNAMVARYDASIRAGIDAFTRARRSGPVYLTMPPTGTVPRALDTRSGVAEFMVAFDADGQPVHVWLLASWPDAVFGRDLRALVDNAHANTAPAASPTRYLLVSVPHYGNRAHELRAHH